jgi:hypothetical protein
LPSLARTGIRSGFAPEARNAAYLKIPNGAGKALADMLGLNEQARRTFQAVKLIFGYAL